MTARTQRRAHRHWTPAEEETLRRMWGDAGERRLRVALGRTAKGIYAHAALLGLPSQVEVARCASIHRVAQRIGLVHDALVKFLASVGIVPTMRAPVGYQSRGHYRQSAVEPEQVEVLFTQRETRTATRDAWAREHGMTGQRVECAMDRAGVGTWNARRRCHVRLPVGVIEEAAAGAPGPWCAVWAEVLAEAQRGGPLPCDAWLLALAAHDVATIPDPQAREWVEWIPQQQLVLARRIARRCRPRSRVRDEARRAA